MTTLTFDDTSASYPPIACIIVEQTPSSSASIELRWEDQITFEGFNEWLKAERLNVTDLCPTPSQPELTSGTKGEASNLFNQIFVQPIIQSMQYVNQQKKTGELVSYIERNTDDGLLQGEHASGYLRVWNDLQLAIAKSGFQLQVPNACPGPDGDLLYTWDSGNDHFECELYPDGNVAYFYKNRKTKESWLLDTTISDAIPEKAISLLKDHFAFRLGEVRGSR